MILVLTVDHSKLSADVDDILVFEEVHKTRTAFQRDARSFVDLGIGRVWSGYCLCLTGARLPAYD